MRIALLRLIQTVIPGTCPWCDGSGCAECENRGWINI
jgi:hypothetical protein